VRAFVPSTNPPTAKSLRVISGASLTLQINRELGLAEKLNTRRTNEEQKEDDKKKKRQRKKKDQKTKRPRLKTHRLLQQKY
jgi:hypothetical protein